MDHVIAFLINIITLMILTSLGKERIETLGLHIELAFIVICVFLQWAFFAGTQSYQITWKHKDEEYFINMGMW
ncbi:hypothetical protein KAR91_25860 [Candidatus Pacearchaeota archaeon]|nr:hypothetical protein [Candidatus Pacearchaeota archaeon]